jgi:hypothetical protein
VNHFHPEARLDLVHKCLNRIAAAIDALFTKVFHLLLLCLYCSLSGVVNISSGASQSNAPLIKLTGPKVQKKEKAGAAHHLETSTQKSPTIS